MDPAKLIPPFVLAVDLELVESASLPSYYSGDELSVLLAEVRSHLLPAGITRVESSPELLGSEEQPSGREAFAVILGFRREHGCEVPVYIGELFWGKMAAAVRDARDAGNWPLLRELRNQALAPD